jgi:predicted lipoprotein with Yx(FWY)xxD motif
MIVKKMYGKTLIWVVTIASVLGGCSKSSYDPGPQFAAKVLTNATVGRILVDGSDRTLYYFANDANGTSSCNGDCAQTWPPFHHNEGLDFPTGLNRADFNEITRADGTIQTTYKGWPLYYYATNGVKENAGQIGGQAVGGTWFVMKPDYAISYSNAQLIGANGVHYTSTFTVGDEIVKYFSDDHGRTIYRFAADRNNVNTFTRPDYSNDAGRPIFYVDINNLSLPGSLLKSDFGVITVGNDNRKQSTYKGWPLYYFGQDALRGDNKGVSLPAPGSWPAVTASIAAPAN